VRLSGDDPRPARLLAGLHERASAAHALRASARLSLDSPDLRFSRPQRIAAARPARMRIEIMGLFNQVAAVLVTDGALYQLYTAGESELEEGVVSSDLLWRVARVDLAPDEAVDLLLGAPRLTPRLRLGVATLYEDGGIAFERRDEHGAVRERLRFDAAGRVRGIERLDDGGELVWQGSFDDYRDVAGPEGGAIPFAFDVALHFPRVQADARLKFKKVSLLNELDEALFELRLARRADDLEPVDREPEADGAGDGH
jgi:hypothetical protein